MNSDRYNLTHFRKSIGADIFDKTKPFMGFINDMKLKGTYTYRRELRSACGTRATVHDTQLGWERQMLMMASNNYLGLNTRPEIMASMQDAVAKYGSGMCGAPLLNGTFDLLVTLEQQLADFCGKEAAMVFSTGYAANVGTVSALLGNRDTVFIDRLSHASIVDGCQLSGATVRAFPHEDMTALERLLSADQASPSGKLIVVDGVYSMDGDVANIPEIIQLARRYNARVMVDEAHALGVLGPHGAGTADHFGLQEEVDIIMGTFSKSLASTGGFIAASREVVNFVRHYARPYFFSASPPPVTIAAVLSALAIIRHEPELRERLWENIRYFHRGLGALGLEVHPATPQSAVMAIVVSPKEDLRAMSRRIHERGVYLNSVEYPAVPKNEPRLRIGIMASHTRPDLDFALDVLRECASIQPTQGTPKSIVSTVPGPMGT